MEVDPSPSTSTSKSVSKTSVAATISQNAIDLYLISDEDAHYEQEILRDPYSSIKPWLRYIEFKVKTGSIQEQVFVYERACKALPRSYKIWKMVIR
jgi:pre-mRNA-splicing factor SYF1